MADETIKFPEQFTYKETPAYNDVVMASDGTTGQPIKIKVEDLQAAAGNNVIGSATPASTPSGTETVGQSYLVGNDTGAVLVFTNFLDSGGVAVQMAANQRSGFLVKNADGWAYVDNTAEADVSNLMEKGGYEGTGQDLNNDINGGNVPSGVTDDLSTYTDTNGTQYVRINNIIVPKGKLASIAVNLSTAGSFRIGVFQKIDASHMKLISAIALTGIAGVNNYIDGTDFSDINVVTDSAYIGIILDGDARVYAKSKSLGTIISTDVTADPGSTIAASLSNSEVAVAVEIFRGGLVQDVNELSRQVSDLSASVQDSIKQSDITKRASSNTANTQSQMIKGQFYINSAGTKTSTTEDWHVDREIVPNGVVKTIGRLSLPSGPTYWAYWNETDDTLISHGTILAADLPVTLPATTENSILYFNAKRPTDPVSVYSQLTVNNGPVLLPFEAPGYILEAVGDASVPDGGGSSNVQSSQDLTDFPKYTGNGGKGIKVNSTEDGLEAADFVEQDTDVRFGTVTMSGLNLADLPTGSTVPEQCEIGDAWLDTTRTDGSYNLAVRAI